MLAFAADQTATVLVAACCVAGWLAIAAGHVASR
jgi:hypothetical protein